MTSQSPNSDPPPPDIFRALADPTRRAILDALKVQDGQTLTALCTGLAGLTRFAVMKHLAVLEQAGLVISERVGREKRHYLNPAPIEEVANRWTSRYCTKFVPTPVGIDELFRSTQETA